LLDRQGRLWAGTDDGAFRYDGKGFVPFALPVPDIPRPSYKVAVGKV
jgi:ligand-binding sensor domain-containing protein